MVYGILRLTHVNQQKHCPLWQCTANKLQLMLLLPLQATSRVHAILLLLVSGLHSIGGKTPGKQTM